MVPGFTVRECLVAEQRRQELLRSVAAYRLAESAADVDEAPLAAARSGAAVLALRRLIVAATGFRPGRTGRATVTGSR